MYPEHPARRFLNLLRASARHLGVPQHQQALTEREQAPVSVSEVPEVRGEPGEGEGQEGQGDAGPWMLAAQKEQQGLPELPERPEPQPLQELPEPSRPVSKRCER